MGSEDYESYEGYEDYDEYSEYEADEGYDAGVDSYQDYDEEGAGAESGSEFGIKGENSIKYILSMVLSMVSIVIILVSVLSTWYVWEITMMNEDEGFGVELTFNERLREVELEGALVDGEGGKLGDSESFSWGDDELNDTYVTEDVGDLYGTISILMILTLISSIAAFIMVVISSGTLQNTIYPSSMHRNLAFISSIGTCILAIVCAVLLAVQLPGAHEESVYDEEMDASLNGGPWDSFRGDETMKDNATTIESSWHPSTGWYMSIVGGSFSAASMLLLYIAAAGEQAGELDEYAQPKEKRSARGGKKPKGKKHPKGKKKGSGKRAPSAVQGGGRPSCPTCGSAVRFIKQYNRHWCDDCQSYVRPQRQQAQKKQCPTCGSGTRFIQEYDRHWCDRCQQYVRPTAGSTASIPQYATATPSASSGVSQRACPVCGSQAEFITQYSDYYCWNCREYFNQLTSYRT